jgi:hypothetical protein
MKKQLLSFLKIRENESYKIWLFFLFSLFVQAGVAIGESLANSMFLIHIGVEQLPIIYMLTPFIILFIYIPIYSFFTKRYSETIFFKYFMMMLMLMNIAVLLFINMAKEFMPHEMYQGVFYFLLLYVTVTVITLYTLLWNFIDTFFDILDSKRVFSIFSAGTAIGAIIGGASISVLTQYFTAEYLLVLWSIFTFFAFYLLIKIPKSFKSIDDNEIEEEELPMAQQLIAMFKNLKSSPYVLVLSIVFLFSIFIATLLEYEYMSILSKDQSVESLALLFAQLYMAVNVFNLIVNFFLFNRLVIRFGVKNILLIQPIVYIIVFGYLSVEVGIEAGVLGFFAVQGLLVAIDYNNQNLLYNGINSKIKYEVRTFIENLGEPFGVALVGALLYFIGDKFSISQIAYLGAGLATVYLFFAFILKYQYPKAMIENLKDSWLDLTNNENSLIEKLPLENKQVAASFEKTHPVLSAKFIANYDLSQSVEILLPFLNSCDYQEFQKGNVLLGAIVHTNEPNVTALIIKWIDENANHLNIALKKELGSLGLVTSQHKVPSLDADDIGTRAAAAVAILNSKYPQDLSKAVRCMYQLLSSIRKDEVVEGLYVLSKSKHTQYAFYAESFLHHNDQEVKIGALNAIYSLCDHTVNALIPSILEIFKNGTSEERLLSLRILQKIGDTESIIALFEVASNLSGYEKRQILELLQSMKLQAIPSLVTVFVEKRFSYSARSIASKALARLAFSQFKALEKTLVLDEIKTAYELLNFHMIVKKEAQKSNDKTVELLSKYFADKHQVVLEFVLEALSLGGSVPSFELIKTSLRSSNAKSRGNAIETIEQSTSSDIFRLLLPLLDSQGLSDVITFYHKNYDSEEVTINDILEFSLESDSLLGSLMAIELMPIYHDFHLPYFREKLVHVDKQKIKMSLINKIEEKTMVNDVDKLSYMLENNILKGFSAFALNIMLEESKIIECSINETLEDNHLYLVLEGSINASTLFEKNTLVGMGELFSKNIDSEFKSNEGTKVLKITKEAVMKSIEIYPEIGLAFL